MITLSKPVTGWQITSDRLTLFSFWWAVIKIFHQLSFPIWYTELRLSSSLLLLVIAILVLIRPQSIVLLILLLTTSIFRAIRWMPFTPNHILFEFYIELGILLILLRAVFNAQRTDKQFTNVAYREEVFNTFAPFARVGLLLLYFFAVLHKLNWDYFNLKISCGAILLEDLSDHMYSFPVYKWMQTGAVWGTLFIEAAIPLMLFFKRTRSTGILLGILFHFILSYHPVSAICSFSALMIGFYSLFTPPAFPHALRKVGIQFRNWLARMPHAYVTAGVGIVGLYLLIGSYYFMTQRGLKSLELFFWANWVAVITIVYVRTLRIEKMQESGLAATFGMRYGWLWLFPGLVLVNGLCPYLGLKTQTSFSMFSNLHTEGGQTNHLFMPRSMMLTNWEDDLVEIKATNSKSMLRFDHRNQVITFFEFRRLASEIEGDFFVDYLRNGQLCHLVVKNGVSNDPLAVKPYPVLVYKTIRFRSIYKGECKCQH